MGASARPADMRAQILQTWANAMGWRDRIIWDISRSTGMRIGEILLLTRQQLMSQPLKIWQPKTGKWRSVSLPDHVRAAALAYAAGRDLIFASSDARRIGKPVTRQAVWASYRRAARRCGIQGVLSPHSGRKTYAVSEYQTRDLEAVQRLMGHKYVGTTMGYIFGQPPIGDKGARLRAHPSSRPAPARDLKGPRAAAASVERDARTRGRARCAPTAASLSVALRRSSGETIKLRVSTKGGNAPTATGGMRRERPSGSEGAAATATERAQRRPRAAAQRTRQRPRATARQLPTLGRENKIAPGCGADGR